MKRTIPLLVPMLAGCQAQPPLAQRAVEVSNTTEAHAGRESAPPAALNLQIYGSLRAIFHDNDRAGKVSVRDVAGAHTIGVGALAGLNGEVTLERGRAWIARPSGTEANYRKGASAEDQACLLVTATVKQWDTERLERDMSLADLEVWIHERAPTGVVVPVLVDGRFADLTWHVMNGAKLGHGSHDHAAHREAAHRETAQNVDGTVVAFFSSAHRGVFTHRDSDLHAHVVLPAKGASGHVEAVTVAAGATVSFPHRSE